MHKESRAHLEHQLQLQEIRRRWHLTEISTILIEENQLHKKFFHQTGEHYVQKQN